MSTFHVAPFEHYMLADDTARYPMTCFVRFWFDGLFERSAFERAVSDALTRHPLLTTVLEGDSDKTSSGLKWRMNKRVSRVTWTDAAQSPIPPKANEVIDPHQDSGIHFCMAEEDGKTLMWVRFHHAHSDGVGMFQLVDDVLRLYHQAGTGIKVDLDHLEPERLEIRDKYGLTASDMRKRIFKDIARTFKFFKLPPASLGGGVNLPRHSGCSSLHTHVRNLFSIKATAAIKQYGKQNNATPNDVMLRDLFLTARDWNQKHKKKGMIRIAMPIDLRLKEDKRTPAANIVSMCFIDHSIRTMRDESTLLASVHKETREILANTMGITLNRVVGFMGRIPGLLRRFLAMRTCKTSMVLTNLGKPFAQSPLMHDDGFLRAHNVTLRGVDTLPPVRDMTGLGISINTYGGRLSLTYRYDSLRYEESDIQAFAAMYEQRLLGYTDATKVAEDILGRDSLDLATPMHGIKA